MRKPEYFLLVCTLLLSIAVAGFPSGCSDESAYHITWLPPKVSTAVCPGGSWEGSISFISDVGLYETELSVVPELEPFIRVYPQSLSDVVADTVNTFEMSIVVPPDATMDESYEGIISLMVGGQACPETLEVRLYVAPPLDTMTEQSHNETMELETEVCVLFHESEQSSGTQVAREITLQFLNEQDEVFDAGISEDGSIWIVYKDGIHALISTSPLGTLGASSLSRDAQVLDEALASTAGGVIPGNGHAILLCPIWSAPEMQPLGIQEALADVTNSLEGIGYDVTPVYDDNVTVDLLKSLYSYGVVDFLTHGNVWSNQVVLHTGEEATFSSIWAHRSDLAAHRLARRSAITGSTWAIRPSFVTHYAYEHYPNSIIVATACSSFANWSMADAFLDAGAYVYAGWTDVTSAELGIDSKLRLFECLTEGMNLQEAFNTLVDEGLTTNPEPDRDERFFFYPLAAGDFVLLGEEEPIYFPDPNLETAIREAIGKPTGDIYPSDLEGLTSFEAQGRNIIELTGLEHATSLTYIALDHNQISDISPLANLTNLDTLYLRYNQISDVSFLANLINLNGLLLGHNQISNISPLANLTNLTFLQLEDNQISDISSLAHLTNLVTLYLGHNQISDISPLANLTNLTLLQLEDNQIDDISPLANLTSLTYYLALYHNQISDISPLASLANLTSLMLFDNQISDISPLANLTNLTDLILSSNQISDISPLANLTSLTDLILSGNQISDISPLANLTNLTEVNLGSNQIGDISHLANLTNLTELRLDYNQISDIQALSNLTSLIHLRLEYNQVSDISAMSNLTSLLYLYLNDNQISNISPLANLTNLDTLCLDDNQISNISPLTTLTNLTNLSLRYNQISNISSLTSITNLASLRLSDNQISDIQVLSNLTNLTWLELAWNQISDISPLVQNEGLGMGDSVWLSGNPLSPDSINTYIPQLEARGVLVDY